MKKMNWILFICFLVFSTFKVEGQILKTINGKVYFKSDAPLEMIEAESKKLRGVIDLNNNTFAFTIPIQSFEGFNSSLQRVHFNENYMESHLFPNAIFTGKIIEKINYSNEGKYEVRAKGKLNIHGVEQERIIKSIIEIKDGNLIVKSNFTILLEEHQIRVPKIVYQKISKEIFISIEAEFQQ
jgi:YceI-like protein